MLTLTLALAAALTAPLPQGSTQVPGQTQWSQPYIKYPKFGKLYCAQVDPTYCDEYFIDGPALQPRKTYPLVIMFHGYGERADKTINGWLPGAQNFINVAKTWTQGPDPYIVVFHDGGKSSYIHPVNGPTETYNTYGTEEFMRATEAVLEDVVAKWPVDRKRMYGYGLSMGGGECLAYAARHQDPKSKTMLSAVVNHSGTVSVTRIYETATPGGQGAWETLFNTGPYGTSDADDFKFQRGTAMDLPFDGSFMAPLDYLQKFDFHLANNLRWISRMNFHVSSPPDDLEHMVEPVMALESFLSDPLLVNAPDQVPFPTATAQVHNWSAIAPADILTYFDARDRDSTLLQFSTNLPPGQNLAEQVLFAEDNVRHHSYSVVRQDPNVWGRLHVKLWKPYFPALNAIQFTIDADNATDNIAELVIHVDQHLKWVDWTPGNQVNLVASDVDLGTIHCTGAAFPLDVEQRQPNGQWMPTTQGIDWMHDGTSLILYEDPSTQLQRQWLISY